AGEAVAKPERARAPPPACGRGLGGGCGDHGRFETPPPQPSPAGAGEGAPRTRISGLHREKRQAPERGRESARVRSTTFLLLGWLGDGYGLETGVMRLERHPSFPGVTGPVLVVVMD